METEKPTDSTMPETYLSLSDGSYRVIHQGMPISKDFPDKTMAMLPAKGLDVSEWAWIGNQGVWIPRSYI